MTEWTDHIKKVSKDKGISYKEAMKVASKTYKPKGKKAEKKPSKKDSHKMPDGTVMSGKKHSKDSKPVKE